MFTNKGKGRITIQFGCSYSYTDHRIEIEQPVERMPSVLLEMIERLRRWGIVRNGAEPDSAIVNIYEAVSGDSNCFFFFSMN
jgi:hypothetical protein